MKIEKRNNHKKKIVIEGMIVTSALVVGILATSYSKYRVTESIKLGEGIINFTPNKYDFNLISMYLVENGTETETNIMPSSGYTLDSDKSYCTLDGEKDNNVVFETKDGNHTFSNIQRGSKCYLYFNKGATAGSVIIGDSIPKVGESEFVSGATTAAQSGLFTTSDNDGITYYYRGIHNSVNNWVDFAGFKWRIIRINGDGSIRMIYNGITTATTGPNTQLGTKPFNSTANDNMYVGFKYTNGQVHGTSSSSTILGPDNSTDDLTLNGFYNKKIKGTKYEQYIDQNAGFCNDRTPTSGSGTGVTETYYAPYTRLYGTNGKNYPSLQCSDEDLFTSTLSDKGNKSLVNPIGLITADEVVYAGGFAGKGNSDYWLCTGNYYWTMSPYYLYYYGKSYEFMVFDDGKIFSGIMYYDGYQSGVSWNVPGVRPVINLRADTPITGSGTTTDPFTVVGL